MKQKFYFIAALLLISHVSISQLSAAIREGECGENLTWTLDTETGALTITGSGKMTDYESVTSEGPLVLIDGEWQRLPSHTAPWGFDDVKSVRFSGEITHIGNYAFERRSNLMDVTIPNSVISIGMSAFEDCEGLTSVTIPNSVVSIGYRAFLGVCNIVYDGEATGSPWGATYLNKYADEYFIYSDEAKTKLIACPIALSGEITIPEGVTSIGSSAFSGCSRMTGITIPNSATSIGSRAFAGCTSLTSVIWNAINCSDFKSTDAPFYYNSSSYSSLNFDIRSQITSFVFGDEVEHVPAYLCSGMNQITSIKLPNSVTSIGNNAFINCNGLTSPIYNSHWFVYMPNSYSGEYIIPDGVEIIEGSAFYYCRGLTSITIPNSVTNIGKNAFYGCSLLTKVIWNAKNVSDFTSEDTPFYNNCKQIKSFVIGNQVEHIPAYLCYGMYNLTNVIIPDNVTSIGKYAFSGVLNIQYSGSATGQRWGALALNGFVEDCFVYTDETKTQLLGCSRIVSGKITLPNSVTNIGEGAFAGCSGLTSVDIPNSVTIIGDNAFKGCSGMTSVEIPNSVTSIGSFAFDGCNNLTSVNIGKGLTSVGMGAFSACKKITSVIWNAISCSDFSNIEKYFIQSDYNISLTIGEEVQRIPAYLCYFMKNLKTVTLPASVNSIGKYAFSNCQYLSSVKLEAVAPPSIVTTSFHSNSRFIVPLGSLSDYRSHSIWKTYSVHVLPLSVSIENVAATSATIKIEDDSQSDAINSYGVEGGEESLYNVIEHIGLIPEKKYENIPVFVRTKGNDYDTILISFTTPALELTTQESKAVSSNTALLFAKTNMSDTEVNCGFEWKRSNAPDDMAGTKVYCPVANGTMAGRLKNLNPDVYYKYRAFYESSAGNKYYGDWQYIFTGDDAVEFDPVMYTYPASAVTETTATLKGYALAGSDEFTEQGFEYWVEVRIIPVNANNAPKRAYHSAVGEHMTVAASGISMKVTLTDLDEGSVYKYRTYAVVDGQKVYGEEQSFTTRGEYLYTVTFVDYDGSVLGTDKVHYGEAATAPNDPAREGYNFSGWDIDFSAVTDDITVTAVYSIATALPDTQQQESVHPIKLIRNGHLIILRDGHTYTVHGQKVR